MQAKWVRAAGADRCALQRIEATRLRPG